MRNKQLIELGSSLSMPGLTRSAKGTSKDNKRSAILCLRELKHHQWSKYVTNFAMLWNSPEIFFALRMTRALF